MTMRKITVRLHLPMGCPNSKRHNDVFIFLMIDIVFSAVRWIKVLEISPSLSATGQNELKNIGISDIGPIPILKSNIMCPLFNYMFRGQYKNCPGKEFLHHWVKGNWRGWFYPSKSAYRLRGVLQYMCKKFYTSLLWLQRVLPQVMSVTPVRDQDAWFENEKNMGVWSLKREGLLDFCRPLLIFAWG